MNVRQDFTDLDKKVNSFVDFLRRLHEITLGQFGQLNQFYLQVKDLEDDNWEQNGEHWREEKAKAALDIFYGVLNIYKDGVAFNDLALEVSTISWVIDDNSLVGIMSGYCSMLNEELSTLWSMSPNDKEALILDVLQRSFSTINRLRQAIENTTRDGYSIYQEIWSFVSISFDEENLDNLKRNLFLTLEQALHNSAQDCFRTLLKAILKSDEIDVAIEEENKSFDELSAKLNDGIANLKESIAKLESQIKFALNASQIIAENNSEIAGATAKMEVIEKYIQKLDSDEYSAQVEINSLDVTSETYEADLAALQATIAEIQSEKASQMESSSNIQADIAKMSAENAELSSVVDQLDEKQDELAYSEKYLKEVYEKMAKGESDHQETLARFERNRQDLPLESSPSQRGGSVWQSLSDRIRVIDRIMVDASGYRGYVLKPETSINVPGMPSFTNSVALDLDFGYALQYLGFGDELLTKFNFQKPIEISSGTYWSIFELMDALYNNKISIERAKEFVDNYSSINFSNPVAKSLETEVALEKIDVKKIEVDANLLKEKTSYDALIQEISDTNSQIQNLEASRDQLNGDISETENSIGNYTKSIAKNTNSISDANNRITDAEATKSAAQVTKTDAEGVRADAQAALDTAEGLIDGAQFTKTDSQSMKSAQEQAKADYLAEYGEQADQTIIDSFNLTISNLEATIAEAEDTIMNASVSIVKAQEAIKSATKSIAVAEDTIAQADATIAQSQVKISEYTSQMESDTSSKMEAETSLNSLLEELRTIENSLNELYSTMVDLKEKSSVLEKSIAELNAFIDNYDATRESMVSFISEMKKSYEETLNDYKLTLRNLYSAKTEIESTIEDLIQQTTVVKSKSNIRNNRKKDDSKTKEEKQEFISVVDAQRRNNS